MMEKKTGYEWCLEIKVRIKDLTTYGSEFFYYEGKINKEEFLRRLELCDVIPNSTPRKSEDYLEYRMYGLVPYNISPIQQGIQFGHAVVQYGQCVKGLGNDEKIYDLWANKYKTFIILNGGTTNNYVGNLGTLNKHLFTLIDAGINISMFQEEDLGNQLTAIVFLVDERVFNRELYPDFIKETLPYSRTKPSEKKLLELEEKNNKNYVAWVEKIGGEKNAFLREFLPKFRLA